MKEIGDYVDRTLEPVANTGHRDDKFEHHRRVFFSANPNVNHIEHMFSPPFPSTRAAPQLQVRVQYSEQLFYTWAITISYGGGHGSHGIQSRNSGRARAEYSGGSRATPRGTHQRGDQPQARNPQKLRELHFADPGKTQLLAA